MSSLMMVPSFVTSLRSMVAVQALSDFRESDGYPIEHEKCPDGIIPPGLLLHFVLSPLARQQSYRIRVWGSSAAKGYKARTGLHQRLIHRLGPVSGAFSLAEKRRPQRLCPQRAR
jgi:hypothetical protein